MDFSGGGFVPCDLHLNSLYLSMTGEGEDSVKSRRTVGELIARFASVSGQDSYESSLRKEAAKNL